MTEKQLMASVIELAGWRGWRGWRGWLSYHPYDSRYSTPGWSDLALVHGGRLILVELKSAVGRVSADQQRWLEALRLVPHVEVHLWRPADWPKTIAEVLS